MKIVTVLHKTCNSDDVILGVYEDIKDATEMMERFKKQHTKSPFGYVQFWLEDVDMVAAGGLVDE